MKESGDLRKVHLIGIGGVGMSALAHLLLEAGLAVSGSDSQPRPTLQTLRKAGARVQVGHDARLIEGIDRVIFSPAIPGSNPELKVARQKGICVQSRAEALAEFLTGRKLICVCGSHGKTTTAAMLAFVLRRAGFDPGYMIGGSALSLGRISARIGEGPFVVEACEAFGALHHWVPDSCVVTNIDDEHVEHYGDLDGLRDAFRSMISRVQPNGIIAVCGDDSELVAACKDLVQDIVTYGIGEANILRAKIGRLDRGGTDFTVYGDGIPKGGVLLPVPGQHNVLNALAVIAVTERLGIPFAAVAKALTDFQNVDRRWQFVGEAEGIRIFDDYAHHPTEVEAVLAVARRALPPQGKLVLAFEPQLHSRVRRLAGRFAKALSAADLILLAPVDPAGESITNANGDELLTRALKVSGAMFLSLPTSEVIAATALQHLKPGDLFVTMGPGKIANVGKMVLQDLHNRANVNGLATPPEIMSVSRGPEVAWTASTGLLERFFEHVKNQPQAPAVSCGAETLSYAVLAQRGRELAQWLTVAGVEPEQVVAVRLERSVDRTVVFLATLMAGGIYMPIDPSLPEKRMHFMLHDARASVMIATDTARMAKHTAITTICPRETRGSNGNSEWNWPFPSQRRAAYIIYTSGTTGVPKGVVVEYGALCNFARAAAMAFDVVGTSRISHVSSFAFDVAIGETAMSLYAGAHLVSPSGALAQAGVPLGNFIRDNAITHLSVTPSTLSTVPNRGYPTLTHVIVAGEACAPDLADRWSLNHRFFNAYGPTEATIYGTIAEHRPHQLVTIGQAMENVTAYVLDADRRPVRRGLMGELWLAGAGLARGYLHKPELTAERFPVLSSIERQPVRVYRTGDLATMLSDGRICFLGRIDDQVKLRGFRIELGEVEIALRKHPSIQEAVVDIRKDASGVDQLIAYLICPSGAAPSREQIASFLSRWLPSYMVPSATILIECVPLTPSGKRNRAALPDPPVLRKCARIDVPLKVPSAPIEEELIEILRRELAIEGDVGIRDNLMHMGLDSLQTASLFVIIESHFGVELSAEAISNADTVELLALYIERARAQRPFVMHVSQSLSESLRHRQLGFLSAWTGERHRADSLIFTRNGGGNAPALFWCCQGNQEHEQLALHMGASRPVHGMRSGHLLFRYTQDNICSLAALYVNEMIALQPKGRFRIGGNCQGGTIAREIALQLRARGREVGLLCLMEQGRFPAYDGPVLLIFGARSPLNPYLSIQDPARIFKAAYGANYCIDVIPGCHNEYFKSPNIEVLGRILNGRLGPLDKYDSDS